jgi:hypothetical protein
MKAILIDPEFHAITEVEYGGSLQDIYELIDCTCIDAIRVNDSGDTIYVDDEGLYNSNFYWRYEDYPHPIAGKGLVLGTDMAGESISPVLLTVERLENSVRFITLQTAIAMGEKIEAQNRRYMEANPDGPVIFCGSTADILKDKSYSGESD